MNAMKLTARFFAALCVTLSIGACQTQPSESTPAASDPKAVAPAADPGAPEKLAAADQAPGMHGEQGCIYAEGEKDEGQHECPHGGPEGGADGKAAGPGHFGAPFTIDGAKSLASVIDAGAGEQPVLVEGEVEAVCQKKGCWMVIKDGTQQARVLMKDHGFAVPMDCRGKKAVVEGTLASRTFDEAQVKHLEKDGGGDPEEVSGERTEHVLTASGVRIM